jgi:hypothetical protein
VHRKRDALPVPAAVRTAAVQQGALRRRPERLHGNTARAAVCRGLLLVSAVAPAKAGAVGRPALGGVRDIFRNTWRASSLLGCASGAVRMQQARHRKLAQGLLGWKRL